MSSAAAPDLRIRPQPTAEEAAAIRQALAALGLLDPARPAGSAHARSRRPPAARP
ncbi:MAG: hypothetical protein ACTHNU_16695 [Gaiellales bacterium]